jgi:hypothetical protein
MATAQVSIPPARAEWALANPWTWASMGLAAVGLGLAWVRVFGAAWSGVRLLLVFFGLVAGGAAIALRLGGGQGSFLDSLAPRKRSAALLALALAGAALAVAATGLLLASLCDLDIPWEWGGVLRVWLLVFPAGVLLLLFYFRRWTTGQPVSAAAETAALLICAAATAFLGCWGLYVNQDYVLADRAAVRAHDFQQAIRLDDQAAINSNAPSESRPGEDWDTGRMFLAALAAVAFLAAPLVLLPGRWRRRAVGTIILLHFGGIATAVLSPAPAPWVISELWGRVYRPYLEFMYLNNAYHFYAPDPGPSSYLWCYVQYDDPAKEAPEWVNVPNLDQSGNHTYPTTLIYQRCIALMENARGNDTAPPFFIPNREGNAVVNPIYYWRSINSPQPPEVVLGKPTPRSQLVIPYHPDVNPWWSQYNPATAFTKMLVSSYVRHIAFMQEKAHPDVKVKDIKVYWAIHIIARPKPLAEGLDSGNPAMYYPYYQGEFDRDGKLLDEPYFDTTGNLVKGDPFLYWLIPILIDDNRDSNSAVLSWVRRHAGDPHCYRPANAKQWTVPPAELHLP